MSRSAVAWRVLTLAVLAVLTLATAFLVNGSFGLVVAAESLAALGLLAALVITPRGLADLPRRRPGSPGRPGDRGWLARLRFWARPPGPVQSGDFPSYAKISSDLSWASVSEWHFDHGLRPLLTRMTASVLSEHHRVNVATDPARAQRLVGDDVWPVVDPSRPPSFDSRSPGPDLAVLTRIVDRLEQL